MSIFILVMLNEINNIENDISFELWIVIIIIIIIIIHTFLWCWLDQFMRKIYAMCVEWTKLSEVENRSLFIQLLHAVETIKLKLCIKFVCDDCMLKNECSCHSKLL